MGVAIFFVLGFPAFLLLGLLSGAIAKLILPGRQGRIWIGTLFIGVVGAVLGGLLFLDRGLLTLLHPRTWLFSIGGSLSVLVVRGVLTGGRRRRA